MTPLQRVCDQCGAALAGGVSCKERFDELLALDHSRAEPWGSRHGLAFAVFTLQHSRDASPGMIQRCVEMLRRVYADGEDVANVVAGMRLRHDEPNAQADASRVDVPAVFAFTIADMRDFAADTYSANLGAWCRATLDSWSR